jgi:hypothetical protein
VARGSSGDENDAAVGHAFAEATGRSRDGEGSGGGEDGGVADRQAIVLASGNLGLIYLMEEPRRLCLEEIEERHPGFLATLRGHRHIGFLLVHSRERGPVVLGPRGARYLEGDVVEGEDPLAPFPPSSADHLRRTDGFANVADIMVNSFYDSELEQACAFEELISFHGGLGGPQTRPFILHPVELPVLSERLVGATAVHELLMGWRRSLQAAGGTENRLPDVAPTGLPEGDRPVTQAS